MASGLGTALIDFGSTPANEASAEVIGQTGILAGSAVEAWVTARTTADNTANDHHQAAVNLRLVCSQPTEGVGFTITAYCLIGYATGQFEIDWIWSD